MRSAFLKSFFLGVGFGVGVTVLSLYLQWPGCLADSVERVAETGRLRKAKREEVEWDRGYLKAAGISDEEIKEAF